MLKGNQYQIRILDGSSDLMKVVMGLREAEKFSATLKGGGTPPNFEILSEGERDYK